MLDMLDVLNKNYVEIVMYQQINQKTRKFEISSSLIIYHKKYGIVSVMLLIAIIVAGMSLISIFAPFSGAIWSFEAGRKVIENPYGRAEVYYDEYGVPHISAEKGSVLRHTFRLGTGFSRWI